MLCLAFNSSFWFPPHHLHSILLFPLILSLQGVITTEEMNLFSDPVVDLTLLHRAATTSAEEALKAVLLKVTDYCNTYEARVASLGGE